VNRRALLNAALQGNGSLTGDVPELPVDPNYPPQRGIPAQNIAQAKALLKAAGKTDVSFDLHTGDVFPGEVQMATALKQVVAPASRTSRTTPTSPRRTSTASWSTRSTC